MEHPVLATDAEMDEARDEEIIDMDSSKKQRNQFSSDDKPDTSDIDDAEERALSAMSIFSHDSDDDPTWAPSETEKLKLDQKKAKLAKSGSSGIQRKVHLNFKQKGSDNPVEKKGRGRPKNVKNSESDKKEQKRSSQSKDTVNDLKGRKARPGVRIPRQESKRAGTLAMKNRNNNRKSAHLKGDGNDIESDSLSDEELIDLSEKANRVEGAGGNDFHYFCRICKSRMC